MSLDSTAFDSVLDLCQHQHCRMSEDVLTEIRLSLSQVHLPKLADLGIIEHDPEVKVVEEIAGTLR